MHFTSFYCTRVGENILYLQRGPVLFTALWDSHRNNSLLRLRRKSFYVAYYSAPFQPFLSDHYKLPFTQRQFVHSFNLTVILEIRRIQRGVETASPDETELEVLGNSFRILPTKHTPPLLIHTNEIMCWEEGERVRGMHEEAPPTGPWSSVHVWRSFTSDCGIKLQLEIKMILGCIPLKWTVVPTVVIPQRDTPGGEEGLESVRLQTQAEKQLGPVGFVTAWREHVRVCSAHCVPWRRWKCSLGGSHGVRWWLMKGWLGGQQVAAVFIFLMFSGGQQIFTSSVTTPCSRQAARLHPRKDVLQTASHCWDCRSICRHL